jgi:hypothetical protein
MMITLLDERPSGKLCVSYQKQAVVDAVDEIKATTQRIPNLDIAKAKLICLSSVYCNGHSELLIGYNLTSQLITLHDGTAYNSAEVVWNSEPRNIVCMTPYMLAFMANTLEIRMASNGSLIQTLNIPDLHLITSKGDLYFTSSSLIHNYKRDSRILIGADTKVPKNIDRRGFASSSRLSEVDFPQVVYVYRICAELLVGRKDSNASTVSADEVFTRSAMSDLAEDSHSDSSSLDFVHPILSDTETLGGGRSASFTRILGPPPGGDGTSNGSRNGGRRKKALSVTESQQSEELEADRGSVSSTSEYSSHVSFRSSMCSSPDSDTHDDTPNTASSGRKTSSDKASAANNTSSTIHGRVRGLHFQLIPACNTNS